MGGPAPNTTDTSSCGKFSETGEYFHPTEMHGITIQEGDDGNSDSVPTYWFWHPWACAHNKTGCPWVGHGNASRIFESYLNTVGHGAVLNMNIPPERTGKMNTSVVSVMTQVGQALNQTFLHHHAGLISHQSSACGPGVATVAVTDEFDYILSMEDLTQGQRIGNYSIDFRRPGSDVWEVLVPPVQPRRFSLGDRPDGHDPRDQYIGHKRIDTPVVKTSGKGAVQVAQVRLNCIRLIQRSTAEHDPKVYIRQLSLHRRNVPWEK